MEHNHTRLSSRASSLRNFLRRSFSKGSRARERSTTGRGGSARTTGAASPTSAPWPIVPTGPTSATGVPIAAPPDRGRFSIFSFRSRANRSSQPKTHSTRGSVDISTPRPVRPSRSGTESAMEDWREMLGSISTEKPLPAVPTSNVRPASNTSDRRETRFSILAEKPLPLVPALSVRPPSTNSSRTIRPVRPVGLDTSVDRVRHHHQEVTSEDDEAGHDFTAETWESVQIGNGNGNLYPARDRLVGKDSWYGSIDSLLTIPTPTTIRPPSPRGSARDDSPTLGMELWGDLKGEMCYSTMSLGLPSLYYEQLQQQSEPLSTPELEGDGYGDTDGREYDVDVSWNTRSLEEVGDDGYDETLTAREAGTPESLEDLFDVVLAYFDKSV